jgi:hypothetical protein
MNRLAEITVAAAFALAVLFSAAYGGEYAPRTDPTPKSVAYDYPSQTDILKERKILVTTRNMERMSLIADQRAAEAKALAKKKAEARKRAAAKKAAAYRAYLEAQKRRAQQTARKTVSTHMPPGGIAACIRKYESGGDYQAENPSSTASGAYQFLDSTWQRVTGLSGRAKNYSPAIQDAAFYKLWNNGAGAGNWVTAYKCGY